MPSLLSSRATAGATARFGRRLGGPEGPTGLHVSGLGFGAYRVGRSDPAHRAALRGALASGACNVVDTAAVYGDGDSERLIGETLAELTADGRVKREEMVVVTKLTDPSRLEESRARLGLECVDFVLLHCPERELAAGRSSHSQFYAGIRRAFSELEAARAQGELQGYGVSCNTLGHPLDSRLHVSLEALKDCAGPGFSLVQLPFNLLEPEAAFEASQGDQTALEQARRLGLGVLTNRPLNACSGPGRISRLADFHSHPGRDAQFETSELLKAAMDHELRAPSPKASWAHAIHRNPAILANPEAWRSTLESLAPQAERSLAELEESPATRSWAREHRAHLTRLFEALSAAVEQAGARYAARFSGVLERAAPGLKAEPRLARKALSAVISWDEVDCALVGMRRPEYVRELLSKPLPVLGPEERLAAFEAAATDLRAGVPSA